jgi:hypothetical protein
MARPFLIAQRPMMIEERGFFSGAGWSYRVQEFFGNLRQEARGLLLDPAPV